MQRNSVVGTRSSLLWLLILVVIVVLIGAIVGALVVVPQMQASRTEQARLAEVERHYQAGVAFEGVGDWAAAEGEYRQVIAQDAGYKDVTERLAAVRSRLKERSATATAVAIAQAGRVEADGRATVQATLMATQQAVETSYQKGLAYMNLGRWSEAQSELERVLDANPNHKEVQVKLAQKAAESAKKPQRPFRRRSQLLPLSHLPRVLGRSKLLAVNRPQPPAITMGQVTPFLPKM